MTDTPSKYVAKDRKWERKDWLQEKYWGELLSAREIAELCEVGRGSISKNLIKHGIPRRTKGYDKENTISPFTGFYRNQAARSDKQSIRNYRDDPDDGVKDEKLKWQKAARREDHIGDDAIIES